jgi:hypothetical protein
MACGDDDGPSNNGVAQDTGSDAVADSGPDAAEDTGVDVTEDTGVDIAEDTGMDADEDTGTQPMSFTVRIENISAMSAFPLPLSPGAWAVHSSDNPIFTAGEPDFGEGLEAVAEDGKPATLVGSLSAKTEVASAAALASEGPIAPGASIEFDITATPDDGRVSFATMFIPSNDVFLAPASSGLELFDAQGAVLAGRDVTSELMWWNAGTERDEAPNQGPNQVQRQGQGVLDEGPAEGVVSGFDDTTRALPGASAMADVSVTESNGTFTVTFTNVSADSGAIITPFSPVVWAVHGPDFMLFEPGTTASDGIEDVAEDGAAAVLVSEANADANVSTAAVANVPDTANSPGPLTPGNSYTFDVTPDASNPKLSIATMVVESNDAFLAFADGGVALLADDDSPRTAADVEADVHRLLGVWDAGTEANEVPGVGVNQKIRQLSNDVGPDDPNDLVRLYADSTNDLKGDFLGGFIDVTVTPGAPGEFDVTVTNTSAGTVYPGVLTPVAWATHSDQTQFFSDGQPVSAGLELLAEAGDPSSFVSELGADGEVSSSGAANMPDGATAAGPLTPGNSYSFTVTADAAHPQLSIASMVVPSNDTFAAFAPEGITLLESDGSNRPTADIAADIAASLRAWDSGTEANQAGAAGPDQAPRHAGPDVGPAAGDGTVRLNDDPVWVYPAVSDTVRVTITPNTN